jgi:hypothetical protein
LPATQPSSEVNFAVIGGIIGGVVALVLIFALIAFIVIRNRKVKENQSKQPEPAVDLLQPTNNTPPSEYGNVNNIQAPNHHYDDVHDKLTY